MALSRSGFAVGTSPYVTITAEEFNLTTFHTLTTFDVGIGLNPPSVAAGAAYSPALNMWIQPFSEWANSKLTEPKYDGIADSLGMPSNRPDFISEHHVISVMRIVDKYLAPSFGSRIYATSFMPTPISPPTP